jgi:hypothetical protein
MTICAIRCGYGNKFRLFNFFLIKSGSVAGVYEFSVETTVAMAAIDRRSRRLEELEVKVMVRSLMIQMDLSYLDM